MLEYIIHVSCLTFWEHCLGVFQHPEIVSGMILFVLRHPKRFFMCRLNRDELCYYPYMHKIRISQRQYQNF